MKNQNGFSLVSTMVALGVLGVLISVTFTFINNSLQLQKRAQIQGEKLDIKNILRGSLVCSNQCRDLLPLIPKRVGEWILKPECSSLDQVIIKIRRNKTRNEIWSELFKEDERDAVCAQIVHLPGEEPKAPKKLCQRGQLLRGVDFENRTITCTGD